MYTNEYKYICVCVQILQALCAFHVLLASWSVDIFYYYHLFMVEGKLISLFSPETPVLGRLCGYVP